MAVLLQTPHPKKVGLRGPSCAPVGSFPAQGFALVFLGMALLASVLLAADLIVVLADVALLVSLHFVREIAEAGD